MVEWQTTDVVQSPRSNREQRVAPEGAGTEKKETKKRKNRGKRERGGNLEMKY